MPEPLCVSWYRNQKLDLARFDCAAALDGIQNNTAFLAQIRNDPDFFTVAFPSMELETASANYSALYEEPELTKRALTLYVSILHRLGFRLYDPVAGTFDVLSRKDGFAEVLPIELFEDADRLLLYGLLIDRVLRALVLIGFPHYSIYLHNAIYRLYLQDNNYVARTWMVERLRGMTEDLILLDGQHRKAGPDAPRFIQWIQTWRSNDFRKEFRARESQAEHQQRPIRHEGASQNIIKFCDHGVYMRTGSVHGSDQKMFKCQIEVQRPASGHACKQRYPCR